MNRSYTIAGRKDHKANNLIDSVSSLGEDDLFKESEKYADEKVEWLRNLVDAYDNNKLKSEELIKQARKAKKRQQQQEKKKKEVKV